MKSRTGILGGFVFSCCAIGTAMAQTEIVETGDSVVIPVGSQQHTGELPDRGLSRDAVQAAFGDPQQTFPAVGSPPISRWQYPGFTVYFEGDTVIHSVAAHQSTAANQ